MTALSRGVRSMDFWLLTLSFGICGFSTNGLINTHLIAYCADRGIAAVTGAGVLAALGVFQPHWFLPYRAGCAIASTPALCCSGYYSFARFLSLIVVPFSEFDFVSLSIFSIFYGLDWVATGPATFALTNEVFGRRDTPVIPLLDIRRSSGWRCFGSLRRRRHTKHEWRLPVGNLSPAAWPAWWRRCWFCV